MLEANNERAGFSSLKKIFSKNTFRRDTKSAKDVVSRSIIFWYKNLELSTAPKTYWQAFYKNCANIRFILLHHILYWFGRDFWFVFIKKICCLKQEYWRKYGRTHCAESALNNVMDNAWKKTHLKCKPMIWNLMEHFCCLITFVKNNKAKKFLVS